MPNPRPLLRLFALICAMFIEFQAQATPKTAAAEPNAPVCSVITVAPGDGLDALFGHTAIRIRDPYLGDGDVWFDYGVFDPSDWTFWIHYAKGDARYLLVAADPQERLAEYKDQGRAVVEQKLELTTEELQKLEDYLLDDLRHGCGENGYAYRFLDDNCTTRVVGMIEKATGREIEFSYKKTFRNLTDLHLSRSPLALLGANWLMNAHAERQTTVFLPVLLHDQLRETIDSSHPLVKTSDDDAFHMWGLGWGIRTGWVCLLLFMAFFIPFLLLAIPTLLRHKKRKPLPPRPYPDALLFAFIGLIGCLMTFLGFWSLHPELGAFNWNLIWCWPTHILFALLLLFPSRRNFYRYYARVAAMGATFAAVAYFLVPQALPAPLFPVALLMGLRAWRLGWGVPAPVSSPQSPEIR